MGKSSGSHAPLGTQTIIQDLPPGIKEYIMDGLERAEDIALQEYIPYEGQLFEGPTPDQLRGFEEVRDTLGGYKPRLEAAETLAATSAAPVTAESIQEGLSPYQDLLTRRATDEAIRRSQLARQQGEAAATGARSGMDSFRQHVLEGERQRNLNQQLADIELTGSQSAFDRATQIARGNRQQQLAAAGALQGLAGAGQQLGLTGADAMIRQGQLIQQQLERPRQFAYQQFLEERGAPQFMSPFGREGWFGNYAHGAPMGSTQTSQQFGPQQSGWGQAAGLGLTAASIYGQDPTGWNQAISQWQKGGLVSLAKGGGIKFGSVKKGHNPFEDYLLQRLGLPRYYSSHGSLDRLKGLAGKPPDEDHYNYDKGLLYRPKDPAPRGIATMAKGGRVKRYAKGGLTLDEMIELANRSGLNVESMANVYQHNPEGFRDRLEVMLGMTKGYPGLPFEEEEIAAVTEDVTQQRAEGGTSLHDPYWYTREVTPATTTRRRGKDILNPGLELAEGYLPSLTQQKDARAARMSTNTALRDAGQSMEGLGQLAEILGTTNAQRDRGADLLGRGDVSGKTRGMLTEEGTRGLAAAQEQAIKAREAALRRGTANQPMIEGSYYDEEIINRIAEDAGAAKNRIEVDPIARSRHLGHMKKMEAMGDPPPTPPEFSPAPDAPGGGLAVELGEMVRGITQKAPEVEASETVVEEGRPAGEDTERSSIKKAISKLGKAQKNALFQALRGGDQRMVLQALQMLPPEIAALVRNRQISREDIKWARGGLASVKKFAKGDPVKATPEQIDAQIEEWKNVPLRDLPVNHPRKSALTWLRGDEDTLLQEKIFASKFLTGRPTSFKGATMDSQKMQDLAAAMPRLGEFKSLRMADRIYETDPERAAKIWSARHKSGRDPYKEAGEIYAQDDVMFMSSPQFEHLKKDELKRMTKGKESELLHPATVPVSKRRDRGTQFVKPKKELLEQMLRAATPKEEEVVEETVTEGKSSGFGDILKMLSPELRAMGAELMQAREGDEWAAAGRGLEKAGKTRAAAANRKVQEAYAEAAKRRADIAEKTFEREAYKNTPEWKALQRRLIESQISASEMGALADALASITNPAAQTQLIEAMLAKMQGGAGGVLAETPRTWAQQNFSPDPVS